MAAMLQLENISKTYKTDSGNEVRAVEKVSLDVQEAEILSIIGPEWVRQVYPIRNNQRVGR